MKSMWRMMYVLYALKAVCECNKTNYCYLSLTELLKLMNKSVKLKVASRTLYSWLRELEDEGYIKRKRQTRKLKDGRLVHDPTLYILCDKAYEYFNKMLCWSLGIDPTRTIVRPPRKKYLEERIS